MPAQPEVMRNRCALALGASGYPEAIADLRVTPCKEIRMLKIRLLQAVCTVAMLASVPAFAQTNTPKTSSMPAAAGQQAAPDKTAAPAKTSMAPAEKDGLGVPGHNKGMHRTAMTHRDRAMRSGKTDASQDSAVDKLNEQSYSAAEKGQAFAANGSDKTSTDMMKSSGSGSMKKSGSGMSGSGMSGSGATGGTKQ
jgi:hypothetical protein